MQYDALFLWKEVEENRTKFMTRLSKGFNFIMIMIMIAIVIMIIVIIVIFYSRFQRKINLDGYNSY